MSLLFDSVQCNYLMQLNYLMFARTRDYEPFSDSFNSDCRVRFGAGPHILLFGAIPCIRMFLKQNIPFLILHAVAIPHICCRTVAGRALRSLLSFAIIICYHCRAHPFQCAGLHIFRHGQRLSDMASLALIANNSVLDLELVRFCFANTTGRRWGREDGRR